jgi:hypothetical protein
MIRVSRTLALALAAAVLLQPVAAAATPQYFATPEAAVTAIRAALKAGDTAALIHIVGDEHKTLVTTGEKDVDAENYAEATLRLDTFNALQVAAPDERILLVGAEAWPFPVPIIKSDKGWYLDSAQGEQELLNRRIGENELEALFVMGAYHDAQQLYATADRNGDGVREYARQLMSSTGKQDGLYWPADAAKGEAPSPWGPLIARSSIVPATRVPDSPYHGYRYRVLTSQGAAAAGGAYDYIINGHMVAGYGLVAFPAEPGESGVMTFIVNQNGKVFEKALGKDTATIAEAMTSFDPADGWKAVDPVD